MFHEYEWEKWIWDDTDFERMGWHDATIHGVVFGPTEYEVSLDIDDIFEWVHPAAGEIYFQFWVAPCTMVFQNVYDLSFEANPYGGPWLSVDILRRDDPRMPKNAEYIDKDQEWLWTFDCHHSDLRFRSVGLRQYVRKSPILAHSQYLSLAERGGYSFETIKSYEAT